MYFALATATRHWGQYGAPLKEVERVTSVMLECSYKFGGEYGWRVSLSGRRILIRPLDPALRFLCWGIIGGGMVTVSRTWKVL